MSFSTLGLDPSLLENLTRLGYAEPTPVQLAAIPAALAGGDLLVSSQTGSGKTAAFVLPGLQRLRTPSALQGKGPRMLVLCPGDDPVEGHVHEPGRPSVRGEVHRPLAPPQPIGEDGAFDGGSVVPGFALPLAVALQ